MFHVFAITVSPNNQRRELSINTYAKDAWKYYEYGRAGDGVNHNGIASVCKKAPFRRRPALRILEGCRNSIKNSRKAFLTFRGWTLLSISFRFCFDEVERCGGDHGCNQQSANHQQNQISCRKA